MDKKVLFEALNTELAKENIDLEIICKCFNHTKITFIWCRDEHSERFSDFFVYHLSLESPTATRVLGILRILSLKQVSFRKISIFRKIVINDRLA